MKKAMLITVGIGKDGDVANGIAFAIRQGNPDFVLFIGTEKSLQVTLPLVFQQIELAEGQHESRTTANEDDVDRSAAEYIGYIREVKRKGYTSKEIVVDFTSGTKAMSAALVMAALAEEVGSISYVTGERGDGGRVISGTERLNALEPNLMLADGKLRRAADLFNTYQYRGCLAILDDLKHVQKPEVVERVGLLSGLSEAYQAWDRFDHRTAMARLDGLTGHALLPAWGLKRKVEAHKAFLYRITDANRGDYGVERAADLLNNADRRAEEGKFDDAVARLYRLLEYAGQVKLYRDHGGLITENLDLSRLPDALREKYGPRKTEGKVQIGLKESFRLLADLGDPLGQRFVREWAARDGEIKRVLDLRNRSILAHGFGPVGDHVYPSGASLARKYLDEVFPDWRDRAKEAEFPRIGNR